MCYYLKVKDFLDLEDGTGQVIQSKRAAGETARWKLPRRFGEELEAIGSLGRTLVPDWKTRQLVLFKSDRGWIAAVSTAQRGARAC